VPAKPGTTWLGPSSRLYCGRVLGRDVIPWSDGQCGPNNGPQCPDCKGLTVQGVATAASVLTMQTSSTSQVSLSIA
jgi:hypothetical protein